MTDWGQQADAFLIPFYTRFPLVIVRGKNHWVWDKKGRKYLDLTSGIGVTNFGHANSSVNRAVSRQMKKISHISNLFIIPGQIELATKIGASTFPGKAFFCNSGAEANEAALKIARIYGNKMTSGKSKILALNGSFHGRTIATVTLTGQEKYRTGFEPLLQNIEFVGINNIADLRTRFDETVCAIFLEAVQGEGGIHMLSPEFINEVAELAKKRKALVIFDEIQCGMGRTGKHWGYQHFDIEPDIISMAKALGNGFPIGAVWVKNAISDVMPAGMHASTFGGNFAACAAGCASFDQLKPSMLKHIETISDYLKRKVDALIKGNPRFVTGYRIYGLMIGIEIAPSLPVKDVIDALMIRGILTLRAGTNVLRLLPPFTIGKKEIDQFIYELDHILEERK